MFLLFFLLLLLYYYIRFDYNKNNTIWLYTHDCNLLSPGLESSIGQLVYPDCNDVLRLFQVTVHASPVHWANILLKRMLLQ